MKYLSKYLMYYLSMGRHRQNELGPRTESWGSPQVSDENVQIWEEGSCV